MTILEEKIKSAYSNVKNYPELAGKLIEAGVQSYTVEVSTGAIVYRFADGLTHLHAGAAPKTIDVNFNEQLTIKAIRDNQQGKSDYPGFMNAIADAGIRFYEATLNGKDKRVTYIGFGGCYEEAIPV